MIYEPPGRFMGISEKPYFLRSLRMSQLSERETAMLHSLSEPPYGKAVCRKAVEIIGE